MINNAILPTLIYLNDQIIFVSRKPEAEGLEASGFPSPDCRGILFCWEDFLQAQSDSREQKKIQQKAGLSS